MIWKLPRSVPVLLSIILTIGCNSSAKQVRIEGVTSDLGTIAMVQEPPEQPPAPEHPIISLQHSTIVIRPESGIDLKILAVTPGSSIDYKIAAVTPAPGIDYKMHIVPNQGQLRHAIGELEFPLRPKLQVPPVPWKPKKPAIDFQIPIVTLNPNMSLKILAVTPDPNIDYKIAAATPAPGIDYKMLVVPNQGQLRHAIGEPGFPLRPKLEVPPVPWKRKHSQRSNTK